MKKQSKEPLDGKNRYLHNNGVLHRDIKPDNILVTAIDENSSINGKLTDFGSARNINMMMTNMTFTKGIGTPKYMAPEVLNKQKYKTGADVFSFAVTMYEVFGWCEAYPKSLFSFPWKIAEFIVNGNRREKPTLMDDDIFKIIEKSWAQVPTDRFSADQLVEALQNKYDWFNQ